MNESDIQKAVVTMLRYRRLDCVWWHTPNQGNFPVQYRRKLAAMGLLAGVADLVFIDCPAIPKGVGFIELKTKDGRKNPNQEAFAETCAERGIPYEVVKSSEPNDANVKVLRILRKWGVT